MDSTETARVADIAAAAETVRALASQMLEERRYAHSVGTAATAAGLCARYGLDGPLGYLAGMAHDLCKELPPAEQLALASVFAGALPRSVFDNPRLHHGPAAAVFLEREGLSSDPSVLEAVAYHTVGRQGMGPLALVVYIADKIEPSKRKSAQRLRTDVAGGLYDGPDGLRRLAVATIANMLDDITSDGRAVAATTLDLYNSLSGKSVRSWPVL